MPRIDDADRCFRRRSPKSISDKDETVARYKPNVSEQPHLIDIRRQPL
jgi:hypothetical protein